MIYPYDMDVKAVSKGKMSRLQRRAVHRQIEQIRVRHQYTMKRTLLRGYRAELTALLDLPDVGLQEVQDVIIRGRPYFEKAYEVTYAGIADDIYPMLDTTDKAKALWRTWDVKGKKEEETAYEVAVREWIRKECGVKIAWIDDTTLKLVRQAYEASVNQIEFRESLTKIFDSPIRCNAIARTETACATNRTSLETMKSLDFKGQKSWMAVGDQDTRDTHMRIDGMTVGMDDDFQWDGEHGHVRMACPLDHTWNPPAAEVVNCRCDVVFDF